MGDPSVGPYDGSDDTLVGIVNDSDTTVRAVTVSGPGTGLSLFDGDGICTSGYGAWSGSSGCQYGNTGYEGPGTSLVTNASLPDSAQVNFTQGLAPGKATYFALEGALTSAKLTAIHGPLTFTVTGGLPVKHSSSQDTSADAPKNEKCDARKFSKYEADGQKWVQRFQSAGLPASAELLAHFLAGSGTEVDFANGSAVSNDLLLNPGFNVMNARVKNAIANELFNGNSAIKFAGPPLERLALYFPPELAAGFRGTQGITIDASGSLVGNAYTGTITYKIEDSYGFSKADATDRLLAGAGAEMRYLQTVCGAPRTPGGAQWFPDSITVQVPFSIAAK